MFDTNRIQVDEWARVQIYHTLKFPRAVSASKQARSDVERPKVALTTATTEKTVLAKC